MRKRILFLAMMLGSIIGVSEIRANQEDFGENNELRIMKIRKQFPSYYQTLNNQEILELYHKFGSNKYAILSTKELVSENDGLKNEKSLFPQGNKIDCVKSKNLIESIIQENHFSMSEGGNSDSQKIFAEDHLLASQNLLIQLDKLISCEIL